MDKLYHYTSNTGHCKVTYKAEINRRIYFILNRFIQGAFAESGIAIPNMMGDGVDFNLFAISEETGTAVTLSYVDDRQYPILELLCAKQSMAMLAKARWLYETVYQETMPLNARLETPYIISVILPHYKAYFDKVGGRTAWTGDFATCIGFGILAGWDLFKK